MTEITHEKTDTKGRYVLRRGNDEAELTYSIASADLQPHVDPLAVHQLGVGSCRIRRCREFPERSDS